MKEQKYTHFEARLESDLKFIIEKDSELNREIVVYWDFNFHAVMRGEYKQINKRILLFEGTVEQYLALENFRIT